MASTEVVWWLGRGPDADQFRELFADPWNRRHTRVQLTVLSLDGDSRNRTVAALQAGAGPDLVMIPRAGDFTALARRGYFVDLAPYAGGYGWPMRLLRPALRLAAIDDCLYGLPRSSETMLLLTNPAVAGIPSTLAQLERAAARAQRDGLLPFGCGCGDFLESCELLWTLVVNHYAGPVAVRAALRGELAWTAPVFVEAIELLQSWFDQGWFGDRYFSQTIDEGVALLVDGRAAMSPAMTGLLPRETTGIAAAPFPALRPDLRPPLYVFGTASLVGINARSAVPDEAAAVLDAVFRPELRRSFAAREPGDWNIPLADADSDALNKMAPAAFAVPAVGLTDAVNAGHFGYASWSYLAPAAEAVVVAQLQPLAEGRLTAAEHLADLHAAFRQEPAPALD